jgi:hypothetical protein
LPSTPRFPQCCSNVALHLSDPLFAYSKPPANGCELPVLAVKPGSGPAFIINEEARSPWNELQMHLTPEAGSAPARLE